MQAMSSYRSDPRPTTRFSRNLSRAGPPSATSSLYSPNSTSPTTSFYLSPSTTVPPYTPPDTLFVPPTRETPSAVDAPSTLFSESWSDAPFFGPSHARIEELDSGPTPARIEKTQNLRSQPVNHQAPTPPHEMRNLPITEAALSTSLDPMRGSIQSRTVKSMTSGQASLFDSLFSLAQPGDDYYNLSTSTYQELKSPIGHLPSPKSEKDWESSDTTRYNIENNQDPEGVRAIMCRPLTLDCNVESNSLPFILESCGRMVFQPLRVARIGREYVFRKYARGELARSKLMLISHAVRIVARDTEYDVDDLPPLATLRAQMSCGYLMAHSTRDSSGELEIRTTSDAFDHSYELMSLSVKLFPLEGILTIMQAAAPLFRRCCPDPPHELVHLPSLLLHVDVSLRYFSTVDILLSALTNRPMFFRYNVSFTSEVTESMLNIDNHLGLQWLYGVPDRLVVTLARINSLREDFGICTDEKIIQELELEIGGFKSTVGTSTEPILSVGRLIGLCGADSEDVRVTMAHSLFMKIFKDAKPGRHPDLFLVLPMVIVGASLGIASHCPEDRLLIRQRMINLPDCARPRTLGYEMVQMLEDIWAQTDSSGRATVWSDLRLACLRVTGV
ncbi:hypothetical protein CTheo_5892 [Ceratobasidium theobromae]|uniref:Uncharacterized protein n=1 Tax=Ceratobasidium theobromae TaxID=1582974 RepID=A0A5N5QGS1_9AGAM|nr:hypothetical protein CTheo_5892 [Ceratobasidium theobromae]